MKQYKITYNGKFFSLNDLYSSNNWRKRNGLKKKYGDMFNVLISAERMNRLNQITLDILYNSRHDVDNVVGMEKVFVDCLVQNGIIADDSKRYFKRLTIEPSPTLPHNTIIFTVTEIDE